MKSLENSSGCTSVRCLEDMIREAQQVTEVESLGGHSFPFEIKVRILSQSAWPEFKEYNNTPLTLKIEAAQLRFDESYS